MTSLRRIVILFQGVYYTLTGIWPLVNLSSFEAVTGPKTDHWLVYMVGLLAAVIGMTLLLVVWRRELRVEHLFLSTAAAFSFAGIDIVFSLNGTISKIYLADAVAQAILMAGLWLSPRRPA